MTSWSENGGFDQWESAPQALDEVFGEPWAQTRDRLRGTSPHGHLPTWDVAAFLVKSGDDLRQEQFAMQLVGLFDEAFGRGGTGLRLRPYKVVATGPDSGLIEIVPDAVSLAALRERMPDLRLAEPTLGAYFVRMYGSESTPAHKAAQRNFIESMAAYAVVCYLLQVLGAQGLGFRAEGLGFRV